MGALLPILTVLIVALAGVYQLYVSPLLTLMGVGRDIQLIGHHEECYIVPEVQGCEKLVLHQATGTVYMSCSTLEQRALWLNPSKDLTKPITDGNYIATYNDHKVTRLHLENFDASRSISFHGMDVVPSSTVHNELFVYLIHHRLPLNGQDPAAVGFDSCIEIFTTYIGSDTLVHVATVEDALFIDPNDVRGMPDGKSFFFTNSGAVKMGSTKYIRELLSPASTVVYCHLDSGCKVSISGLSHANGITSAPNGTFYVASTIAKGIRVLDKQQDNTLVLDDLIPTDMLFDGVTLDHDGILWGAGIPRAFDAVDTMKNSSIACATSVYAFSINTGMLAFYGEKYKVAKMFEDDGKLMSLTSSVVRDSQRRKIFYHGVVSPWLLVCPS